MLSALAGDKTAHRTSDRATACRQHGWPLIRVQYGNMCVVQQHDRYVFASKIFFNTYNTTNLGTDSRTGRTVR